MAPSTLGTFLRSFTFGHVRQLDRVLGRGAAPGVGPRGRPGSEQLVIDLDSTICEVCGKAKHGAGYGYTKMLGYHPLLAVRAGPVRYSTSGCARVAANTQRGAVRFVEELVARVRRAGATGELIMRFDSGFWSNATMATLERLDVGYTMGVRMVKSVARAVEAIDESAWTPIDYTADGEAEVAECDYKGRRLIVRRTRLVGRQATLWPQWRHFAFVTDIDGDCCRGRRLPPGPCHRRAGHPRPEGGRGHSSTSPRVNFFANSAWLLCRPRPRPHPLDRHARRHHPEGPPHRGPHRAHPVPVRPRPPRQSLRPTDTASTARVAVGRGLQPGPRSSARPAAGPRVVHLPRPAHRRRRRTALTTE